MQTYFGDLKPRHRALLNSVAARYRNAHVGIPSIDPASLLYAYEWSHGDGERLCVALRNRSAYGHAHYFHPKGRKAERRLEKLQWEIWTRIMDAAKADLKSADPAWRPCPESLSYYMLEVVPPEYFRGGFACGEAFSHSSEGYPIYLCFRTIGGQSYCRYATLKQAAASMEIAA